MPSGKRFEEAVSKVINEAEEENNARTMKLLSDTALFAKIADLLDEVDEYSKVRVLRTVCAYYQIDTDQLDD